MSDEAFATSQTEMSVCDLSRVPQDDWAKYLKEGMNVTLLTWNGKVSTTQCLGAGGRHSRGALVLQVIDVEVANSVVLKACCVRRLLCSDLTMCAAYRSSRRLAQTKATPRPVGGKRLRRWRLAQSSTSRSSSTRGTTSWWTPATTYTSRDRAAHPSRRTTLCFFLNATRELVSVVPSRIIGPSSTFSRPRLPRWDLASLVGMHVAAAMVWEGAVPIQLSLYASESAISEPLPPLFLLAPRCTYLPLLAEAVLSHHQEALPPGVESPLWFAHDGLALRTDLSVGVLFDLLASGQRPWRLTVHRSPCEDGPARCGGPDAVRGPFFHRLKARHAHVV